MGIKSDEPARDLARDELSIRSEISPGARKTIRGVSELGDIQNEYTRAFAGLYSHAPVDWIKGCSSVGTPSSVLSLFDRRGNIAGASVEVKSSRRSAESFDQHRFLQYGPRITTGTPR